MISEETLQLFVNQYKSLGTGMNGSSGGHPTVGIVVNTDDPLQQGRLQIFCPALGDNPKKVMHLPWCAYLSPFGGSVNNKQFARGTGDGEHSSEGAVHYGFWAIPDVGAHALVTCIDGDSRRRVWVGCLPEHQETHTLLTGRFDWSSKEGTPDGPLTSKKEPIQPLYDNQAEAFGDKRSPEWQSRGADFQITAISKDEGQNPNMQKGSKYLDEDYEDIAKKQKPWVKDIIGAHGYDWSGFKNLGAMKASRVFGFGSPGMHSFSMDDRPFNMRSKWMTPTGHMVLLDDTNERIYIKTSKGKNWVEMDSNGNIDVYSERRVSIRSAEDINLTADGTIRFHATEGIHMYAGTPALNPQPKLAEKPQSGEIRIQSEADMHLRSALNIRTYAAENVYHEVGNNLYQMIHNSSFTDVQKELNVRAIEGDYNLFTGASLNETVTVNSKRFATGTNAMVSEGANEVYSFGSTMSIGSKDSMRIKSADGDVEVEVLSQQGGGGNFNVNTPKSQITVGQEGLAGLTTESTNFKAGKNIDLEISHTKTSSKTTVVNIDGIPEVGDCAITPPGPVAWTPGQPLSKADAAKVAYNAGFRGKDLTIAVALMGGESSYNPSAKAGSDANAKWGPAVGLFQIRTLNDPTPYAGTIDALRDNRNGQLEDPNYNAKVAYQIFSKCSPPGEWTVGKWESFQADRVDTHFSQFVEDAATAVEGLCGTPSGASAPVDLTITYSEGEEELMGSGLSAAAGSFFSMSSVGTTLQSATNIDFKSLATGAFNTHAEITTKLNSTIVQTDMLSYCTGMIVPAISALASSLDKSFSVPFSFDMGGLISAIYSGAMPPQLSQIAGSLGTLNSQISALGGLGLSTPITLQNMVGQLQGNAAALSALGLPTNLSFPINPASMFATQIVPQLNKLVQAIDIPKLELPTFRPLVDRIFQNATYPVGTIPFDLGDLGL